MKVEQIALEALALKSEIKNLRNKADVPVSTPKSPEKCKDIALHGYAEKLKEIIVLYKSYLELIRKDCNDIEQSLEKLQDVDTVIAEALRVVELETKRPPYLGTPVPTKMPTKMPTTPGMNKTQPKINSK